MLAKKTYEGNNFTVIDNVVQLPKRKDKYDDTNQRGSTEMECLYTEEEILRVKDVFQRYIDEAGSLNREYNARRSMTMYLCAINIGLRSGDLCRLRWSNVYDENWEIKKYEKFAPQKQKKRDSFGNITERKYIELIYNSDFCEAVALWREWLLEYGYNIELDDYMFKSNRGGHITEDSWYKTVVRNCKLAGIKQPIGTHGLRKTYGRRYYLNSERKDIAIVELMSIFGHSSVRITLRYICILPEEIRKNQERICMFNGTERIYE